MELSGGCYRAIPYALLVFIMFLSAMVVLAQNTPSATYVILGLTAVVPFATLVWISSSRHPSYSTRSPYRRPEGLSRVRSVSERVPFVELAWPASAPADRPPPYQDYPPPSYEQAASLPPAYKY